MLNDKTLSLNKRQSSPQSREWGFSGIAAVAGSSRGAEAPRGRDWGFLHPGQIHSDLKISHIEMEHEDPDIAEIRGSDKSGTIRRIYIADRGMVRKSENDLKHEAIQSTVQNRQPTWRASSQQEVSPIERQGNLLVPGNYKCGQRFRAPSEVERHRIAHHGATPSEPFICVECGECFTKSTTLIRHKQVHKPIFVR
ncbi:zinc finger protein [Crotalus adamanteus]|uniref:Zinc finger protein n=1 Tax=Crotalus adamanteus TaxID=8729 RepID=A0AAW1BYZ3_CROAD